MIEEQEKLFKNDPFIAHVIESKANITLVGGAVSDILEGRRPKDYDVLNLFAPSIVKMGLDYQYDTKTATTYKYGFVTVQALKRQKQDFDFKISQSQLSVDISGKMTLTVDSDSFNKKVLIPTDVAWIDMYSARNSLARVKHWKKKGYEIHNMTYKSLKKVAKLRLIDKILNLFSNVQAS